MRIVEANIDKIDAMVINSLMEDGRKSFRQIAKQIGVSTPTVESHFSKLMGLGIIKNIVPIFDMNRIQKQTIAFVYLKIDNISQAYSTANKISSIPEVKYVSLIVGEYNLMFKVVSDTPEHLEELVRSKISTIKGIESSALHIVTRTMKEAQDITIREGIPVKIHCDFCDNEIQRHSKTLHVGPYERHFCCNSCLTLYKQKYKSRIEGLSKKVI